MNLLKMRSLRLAMLSALLLSAVTSAAFVAWEAPLVHNEIVADE